MKTPECQSCTFANPGITIDGYKQEIEKMSKKQARATWYSMWGSCLSNMLEPKWWKNNTFGQATMLLAEKVGESYDIKTFYFESDKPSNQPTAALSSPQEEV